MASITCGNCKATHSSAAAVKACYNQNTFFSDHPDGPAPTQRPTNRPASGQAATDKQQAFLRKLLGERDHGYPQPEEFLAGVFTSRKAASAAIEALLALPKKAQPQTEDTGYVAEAKKGDVHVVDGIYYRIHVGQRSGKPYACQAFISGAAEWAEDGSLISPAAVQWDIAKGMIRKLSHATKATPAQAAAFGKLVGRCCFCSHQIDTPESTAAGYGPVCASKYGLPWGDTTTTMEATV